VAASRVLLACLAILAGCSSTSVVDDAGASAGAGYRWLTGELEASFPEPVDQLTAATLRAFDELGLVAIDNAVYGPGGKITGRMADGTKVRVKLRTRGDGGSWLAIRVGDIGDEPVAMQLLRHIGAEVEEGRGGEGETAGTRAR
jgi:hypothetical protein